MPLVVASANGLAACKRAMELLREGGDPLDAAVAGVNLVEDDPNDHSVGYGGLPNEDGVVECDACVMHGPTHEGGAVGALRNIRNASSVAREVMRRTDHVLIVGEGALRFARAQGFQEQELLTDETRAIWQEWKSLHAGQRGRAPGETGRAAGIEFTHGTVTCVTLSPGGDLAGCTSTSGRSYKLPGRVGDSPILGAGLYVDNEVGACGSTGLGEANQLNCTCFQVVEAMRHGMSPEAACCQALRRVADHTEPRLRQKNGHPRYQLKLYAVSRAGVCGGGAMLKEDCTMAVHDGTAAHLVPIPGLYPPPPRKRRRRKPHP
jgi:N4-(beta-N-acetylglucosaminyl)-L-asparaginase